MAQFARPDSAVSNGLWTATPLFEKIDEATRSDADLVSSGNNTSPDVAEVGLSNVTDPTVHTGHILRYTYRKSAAAGHSVTFTARLMQGATEIASWAHTAISETFVLAEQTLSEVQAGNITDYTDLRVRIERSGDTGGAGGTRRSAECSWVEFEVPTRFYAITGDITTSFTPAATIQYVPAPNIYEITGNVTTTFTPAATILYLRPISHDEAAFDTGEIFPHGLAYGLGWVWVALSTNTAGKLLRVDPDDLTSRTTLTFPSDAKHARAYDLVVDEATQRVYVLFNENEVVIAEVQADLTTADVVDDATGPAGFQAQSFAMDDTYYYVLTRDVGDNASNIRRYARSDGSFVDTLALGDECHSLRLADGSLYATGVGNLLDLYVARISTATFTIVDSESDTSFDDPNFTDDFAFTSTHLFAGAEGAAHLGELFKFDRADLTSWTSIQTLPQAVFFVAFDGWASIWVGYSGTPGIIARVDPTTLAVSYFYLESGFNSPNEFLVVGTRVYGTTSTSPANIFAFDLNQVYNPDGIYLLAGDITTTFTPSAAMEYVAAGGLGQGPFINFPIRF